MIIWSIAKTTVGDAMRKKVLQIFLVIAMGLIVISLSFSQTLTFSANQGSTMDLELVKSFGLGLMALAGWLIALVMGVSLIPQEIERRTIYTILSKPVKRYEFIIGKFLGAILTLAICVALMGIVFVGVVAAKAYLAHPAATSIQGAAKQGLDTAGAAAQKIPVIDANMLIGVVMVFLQFFVLVSVVMMFSVVCTPTVNFFLGLGVYIVGLLSSTSLTLANSKDAGVFVKVFYTAIHWVIPNFDKFNVTNVLLYPEMPVGSIALYTLKMTLYGLLFSLGAMLVSIIIFEGKEV